MVYRLVLQYKLTATEGGKYKPTLPSLNRCGSLPRDAGQRCSLEMVCWLWGSWQHSWVRTASVGCSCRRLLGHKAHGPGRMCDRVPSMAHSTMYCMYCCTAPVLHLHCRTLYDSPLEGQMYMVHEAATKKLVAVGDTYPEHVQVRGFCVHYP